LSRQHHGTCAQAIACHRELTTESFLPSYLGGVAPARAITRWQAWFSAPCGDPAQAYNLAGGRRHRSGSSFDFVHLGAVAAIDFANLDGAMMAVAVALLHSARIPFVAVDQERRSVISVFDSGWHLRIRGLAGADDDDGLILDFIWSFIGYSTNLEVFARSHQLCADY